MGTLAGALWGLSSALGGEPLILPQPHDPRYGGDSVELAPPSAGPLTPRRTQPARVSPSPPAAAGAPVDIPFGASPPGRGPVRTLLVYDNTVHGPLGTFGTRVPPAVEIGDELLTTAPGILDSLKFSVFNAAASWGRLVTADLTLTFHNRVPDSDLFVYAGGFVLDNAVLDVTQGTFKIVSVTGLAPHNIALSTDVLAILNISDLTGGANFAGQAIFNPPVIGASADSFYWRGAWTNFGGGVPANFAWALGVAEPSLSFRADRDGYEPGDPVFITVLMNNVPQNIVAAQFFLTYDPLKLEFVAADPAGTPGELDPAAPFSREVYECAPGQALPPLQCTPTPGQLDYAVAVPDSLPAFTGIHGTAELAILQFTALTRLCHEPALLTGREHAPPTRLADYDAQPVTPPLVPLTLDDSLPPSGSPVTAIGGAVDADCSFTLNFAATLSDNGCLSAEQVTVAVDVTSGTAQVDNLLLDAIVASDRRTLNLTGSARVHDVTACPATLRVRVTAWDCCGNGPFVTEGFAEVLDLTPPDVSGCPLDQFATPAAGGCLAEVTWAPPEVADGCGAAPTAVYEIDLDADGSLDDWTSASGYAFAPGTHRVTVAAQDACGNVNRACSFLVHVAETNELLVTVQLRGSAYAPPFTRCVVFELYDCPSATPRVIQETLTFTAGPGGVGAVAGPVALDVPCGGYTCIRARDPLHSLWSTSDDLDISAGRFVGRFTNKSSAGGADDRLVNGELNGDGFIDILDFALFVGRFGQSVPGGTTCDSGELHPDFNGDALVDTADFTFIQAYFLAGDDANCCGLGRSGQPRARISVQELLALHIAHLAAADLNADGWIDSRDIAAFAGGARPPLTGTTDPTIRSTSPLPGQFPAALGKPSGRK